MTIERFALKFFARPGAEIDDAIFIDIFHEWIRLRRLSGVLLDVADYRHVPEGPGIMLITHEINFSMDYAGGRFGLFAQRKRGGGLTHQARLLDLVRATAEFGALLEADSRVAGRLSLEAGAFHYLSNDRLALPNSEAGFTAVQPDLVAAAGHVYADQTTTITRIENDPRDRLTILVDSGQSLEMQALLDRVGVAA